MQVDNMTFTIIELVLLTFEPKSALLVQNYDQKCYKNFYTS